MTCSSSLIPTLGSWGPSAGHHREGRRPRACLLGRNVLSVRSPWCAAVWGKAKAYLCFRPDREAGKARGFRGPRSIVSAGHLPGLRLMLVSLGVLQVMSWCPETFLGTLCGQHLLKVELVLPTAPSPHLGSHPGTDRASVPSLHRVTVLLDKGRLQSTAALPKAAGHPELRHPILKAQVGGFRRGSPGVDQVAFPSPRGQCFLASTAQHRTEQLRNSSNALTPCSGCRSGQGWLLPGVSGGSPRKLLVVTRVPCSPGFTVSVHTGHLLLVSVSLRLFP